MYLEGFQQVTKDTLEETGCPIVETEMRELLPRFYRTVFIAVIVTNVRPTWKLNTFKEAIS